MGVVMIIRLLVLSVLAGLSVSAQSTFGTILGTVTDKSGAAVPGAKIVITNEGENVSRDIVSDSIGNYEALNLKAGTYTIAAEASGFRKFAQKIWCSTPARPYASMWRSKSVS